MQTVHITFLPRNCIAWLIRLLVLRQTIFIVSECKIIQIRGVISRRAPSLAPVPLVRVPAPGALLEAQIIFRWVQEMSVRQSQIAS